MIMGEMCEQVIQIILCEHHEMRDSNHSEKSILGYIMVDY